MNIADNTLKDDNTFRGGVKPLSAGLAPDVLLEVQIPELAKNRGRIVFEYLRLILCIFSFCLISSCIHNPEPTFTKEEIQRLSASNDYDAMLEALTYVIKDCNAVKDEYLDGNLTDKDAGQKIIDIKERYQPIIESLIVAEENGELTYNQHKKVLELFGGIMGIAIDGLGKFLEDMGLSFEE